MNIAEKISKLVPDLQLTEEFVNTIEASFENAVSQRVSEKTQKINEEAEEYAKTMKDQLNEVTEKANAYAEYVVEEITKKVEDYCEFVIEQFIQENKEKFIDIEEYGRMASTLHAVREAFERNYFQMSENPGQQELNRKLAESRSSFNALFEEHRKLKTQLENFEQFIEKEARQKVFDELTEDLAESQKEKIEKLIEQSNFKDIDGFKTGLSIMVEEFTSHTPEKKKETPESKKVITEGKMAEYLSRL